MVLQISQGLVARAVMKARRRPRFCGVFDKTTVVGQLLADLGKQEFGQDRGQCFMLRDEIVTFIGILKEVIEFVGARRTVVA